MKFKERALYMQLRLFYSDSEDISGIIELLDNYTLPGSEVIIKHKPQNGRYKRVYISILSPYQVEAKKACKNDKKDI